MIRKQEKRSNFNFFNPIKEHVSHNKKEYAIVAILFLIGVILGVLFINHMTEQEGKQIAEYIQTFIDCLKTDYQIDSGVLLKNSIVNNIILALLIWFMGSTVIGIPVVYILVGIKGFCLGYSISAILATLGLGKGILFSGITLLFQNILVIPCVLALAVSGIKLYQSIMKDKRKENMKMEICRHTIFSLIMAICLVASSFIEVYISSNLCMLCIQFF